MAPINAKTGISGEIDRAIEEQMAQSNRSAGIPISEIGDECWRKIWYSFHWVGKQENLPAQTLRIFETGRIFEERAIQWMRMAGWEVQDTDDKGRQLKIRLAGGILRGAVDARGDGRVPQTDRASRGGAR